MKKIKAVLLLLATAMLVNFSNAQSIEEGKKFLYYEKFISAKNVFEKVLAAKPNDEEATYLLGQVLITREENKDLTGAKEIYRKALEANTNSALLTAGMGHLELLEGKTADARNRFETAISLSKGKSIDVFNAIGAANADFDNKFGDANYAIQKLKLATQIKKFNDPMTYTLMGDAYRKLIDGGNAQLSYESALAVDPKYARAKYRIGKIYQTQGETQRDLFTKYYNDAIALDPSYPPVYNNLFNYYYNFDVVKSGEYLNKFLNLMGEDEPKACYYRTSMKYAQGLNSEVITQANQCITASNGAPYAKLYGIIGYANDKLGDSVKAKSAFEQFFKVAKPENIGPTDYATYAKVLLKFPGNESLAGTYVDKAVELDSTENGKITMLKSIASVFEGQKNYNSAADWYKKILAIKKNPTRTDIYNVAYNYYRGANYQNAVDGWKVYTTAFPEETFGYYLDALAQAKMDSTMALGLALPSYQKVIDLGEAQWATDSTKVKTHLLNSYKYFIQHAANVKKDVKLASAYCTKYLAKEPADAEVIEYKKLFDSNGARQPAARAAAPTPKNPTPKKK